MRQEAFRAVIVGVGLVQGHELAQWVVPGRGAEVLVDAMGEERPICHHLVLREAHVPLLGAACQMIRCIPEVVDVAEGGCSHG